MKRIVLDQMLDPYPVPAGTQGTIEYVDDINQIHVKWDNGSSLALVDGIDLYHSIQSDKEIIISIEHFKPYMFCPRCGGIQGKATSRRVNVTICDQCGIQEALEDFMNKRIDLRDWYVVKELFEL